MQVRQVSIRPTEASLAAGRPALTPELLAASGARYSRNNEGLDAILSKIDFGNEQETWDGLKDLSRIYGEEEDRQEKNAEENSFSIDDEPMEAWADDCWGKANTLLKRLRPPQLDKGVDGIFKMIDYGHQSIADMAPVAMFMDDVSIFAAYYLWSLCPIAGGQESSTRYIKMSVDGLVDPDTLGIPKEEQESWRKIMNSSFSQYEEMVNIWENIAKERPELMRIPKSMLESTEDKDIKAVARMRRNYAFDRARVFIPVAAATNVMMVQSARAWVSLSSHLLSHPLPELQTLGGLIRDELPLVTPRLHKHARFSETTNLVILDEFTKAKALLQNDPLPLEGKSFACADSGAYFQSMQPWQPTNYVESLKHRTNRYSLVGSDLSRVAVRYGWNAVAMAEIRDMNRHRTGTKYCPLAPMGFHAAEDQVPTDLTNELALVQQRAALASNMVEYSRQLMLADDHTYIYYTLLGFQYPFEQTTTADKFVYTVELRTGVGAHYRYAQHFREVLKLAYDQLFGLDGLVMEGTAEPE